MKSKEINNNIRAILFDMVGVLLFKKKQYVPKTRTELNAKKIEGLYNNINDKQLLKDIKEKLDLTDREIDEALPHIPQKYEKFNELWQSLPKLKKKYKMAVINNGNNLAYKYWKQRFGFKAFDFFIVSAQEKIKKPDPRIYLIACKKLGVEPKNCLFMDDLKENIKTAKKLKMKTILWKRNRKKENLKKFLSLVQ